MFDKNKMKPGDAESVIGGGVRIEGTFIGLGDVIVKGEMIGSIQTQRDLCLQEGGKIEANIKAESASIAGNLKGNIKVENKVEMASTARVHGDINCRVLSIEEGAALNGRCRVGVGPQSKKKSEDKEEIIEEQDEEGKE